MLNKINLLKAIVYRIYSSLITFLISLLLTEDFKIALSIGFIDLLIKILSYYLFDEIWNNIVRLKNRPCVIWLTGLPASGKTTIADELTKKFKKQSIIPVLLDGDEIRMIVKQNGFDEDSRKLHNRNVGYMASLFEKQGSVVIVSLISPYDDVRQEIRKSCLKFIEVYISTDLDTCIKRDPKGLYKRALAGEISEFTGVSAPYFAPLRPELILDTGYLTVSQCTNKILNLYKK